MEYVKLKDICFFLPKSKIKAGEGMDNGKYIFFTSSDTKVSKINEYLYDDEAVIIGTGGKPSCNYCKGKFSVSTDNFVLKSNTINIKYLYYFLRNNNLSILEKGFHGAGLKHISKDYVSDINVPLLDYSKQCKIVSTLDSIYININFYKDQLKNFDNIVKSQFIEMFSADFPLKRIDKVCSLKSGTTFDKRYELTEGTMLYCKVSDMNLIGNEKYLTISKTYVDRNYGSKFAIPKNSVVFPKRGGAIGTNKKRITKDDTCVDLNTMGVTPSKALTIEYLYQYFQNIDLLSLCDGSIIPQLNNKNIGPLIIKVPPIVLQSEFASFVEQINKSKYFGDDIP